MWKLLEKHNDEEILAKIGLLLANCERYRIWDQQIGIREDLLKALNGRDPHGVVSQTALATILENDLLFHFSAFTVARLCTADTARWLLEQHPPEKMVRHIASCANDDVREILRPATRGLVDAQNEAHERLRREEAERQSRETAGRTSRHQTILNDSNIDRVLPAFAASTAAQWPELNDDRQAWLGAHISRKLADADMLHRVEWLSEMQVRFPGILRLVGELVGHYGLPLDDDIFLVHALLALDPLGGHEVHKTVKFHTATIFA